MSPSPSPTPPNGGWRRLASRPPSTGAARWPPATAGRTAPWTSPRPSGSMRRDRPGAASSADRLGADLTRRGAGAGQPATCRAPCPPQGDARREAEPLREGRERVVRVVAVERLVLPLHRRRV